MMVEAAKTETEIHHTMGRATMQLPTLGCLCRTDTESAGKQRPNHRATMTLTDALLVLPATSETRTVMVLPPPGR